MKIGIIGGTGRMGQEINRIAQKRNHQTFLIGRKQTLPQEAQVFIDFSNPSSTLTNIRQAGALNKPLVIGTTGWYGQLNQARALVQKSKNTVIYSGNFSLGVNLFWQMLEQACQVVRPFEAEYDVMVHEFHHNQKADSPSGTALQTGQILVNNLKQKKKIVTDKLTRPIRPAEIHVSSTRGGHVPGTHQVFFDGEYDTIELTHTARNRGGFALGAVLTAEKIKRLKPGFYHLPAVFNQIFKP